MLGIGFHPNKSEMNSITCVLEIGKWLLDIWRTKTVKMTNICSGTISFKWMLYDTSGGKKKLSFLICSCQSLCRISYFPFIIRVFSICCFFALLFVCSFHFSLYCVLCGCHLFCHPEWYGSKGSPNPQIYIQTYPAYCVLLTCVFPFEIQSLTSPSVGSSSKWSFYIVVCRMIIWWKRRKEKRKIRWLNKWW